MKLMTNTFISILMLSGTFFSCSKDHMEPNPVPGKPNTVTGRVVDAKGTAIQGATVVAEHTVWYDTHINGSSDVGGQYKITIPAEPKGSWTAKAQLSKTAWGQTYKFDLAVDKPDPFPGTVGAERNFTWKLSGLRAGTGGYYGAHADVYAFGVSVPMEEVKLIFTPVPGEKLIDGSVATVIERVIEDVAGTYMAKDIPVGKYTVKAMHGNKTLLLDYRHDSGKPEVSKTVVFGKYGHLVDTEYNISFWLSE